MLWRTQPNLQLRSLNLSNILHKEQELGPKRLLCIEETENTLSQVWPHFSIALCSIRELLLMFPVAAVGWSAGDFKWHWSWGSGFECYFKSWMYQPPLRSKDRERWVVQSASLLWWGSFLGCHGESNHHAVLCCNSLRNTMARVYPSADLWGCWSTHSKAYFSPPIAIVSCCQQMFCNSSCILLLGTDRNKP